MPFQLAKHELTPFEQEFDAILAKSWTMLRKLLLKFKIMYSKMVCVIRASIVVLVVFLLRSLMLNN